MRADAAAAKGSTTAAEGHTTAARGRTTAASGRAARTSLRRILPCFLANFVESLPLLPLVDNASQEPSISRTLPHAHDGRPTVTAVTPFRGRSASTSWRLCHMAGQPG